jgi:hypothetical protein
VVQVLVLVAAGCRAQAVGLSLNRLDKERRVRTVHRLPGFFSPLAILVDRLCISEAMTGKALCWF